MIRDTGEIPPQAMSKRKRMGIGCSGAEETTPDASTTPLLLPPAEESHVREELFAAAYPETSTVAPADTVPFPDLTTPSTPAGNFSSVPICVQLQLQLQQLNFGEKDDGDGSATAAAAAAAAAADIPLLEGAALLANVKLQPRRESSDSYPNMGREEASISFKNIDSFGADDSTLTPITEDGDGWILCGPQKKTHFRPVRRSGSPYLQPRKAKLVGDGETYYM